MNSYNPAILCGVVIVLALFLPATGAITPAWTEYATSGGELSGVAIADDDSTIIIGGAQLISLTREGQKRWSGWSGTTFTISPKGDYILSARGPVVRLISSRGTLVWERSMDTEVRDVAIAPDLSFVATAGGGRVQTMTFTGDSIASNITMAVRHIAIIPGGKKILLTTDKNAQFVDIGLRMNWSDPNSTHNFIAVAPDGSSFVTVASNRVRMFDGNGNLKWDRQFSVGNAQGVAYSGDGSTIVIGTDGNNVQVLNKNGVQQWMGNATNWVTSVAVSDDGNTIAAGSLDKSLYVYNHAGILLGTFTARNAIKPESVAVTRDGSLIVVVGETAAYGILRTSFTEKESGTETVTTTTEEIITAVPETTLATTTARKTRTATLPTPYPTDVETEESPMLPAVSLAALIIFILCRPGRK